MFFKIAYGYRAQTMELKICIKVDMRKDQAVKNLGSGHSHEKQFIIRKCCEMFTVRLCGFTPKLYKLKTVYFMTCGILQNAIKQTINILKLATSGAYLSQVKENEIAFPITTIYWRYKPHASN